MIHEQFAVYTMKKSIIIIAKICDPILFHTRFPLHNLSTSRCVYFPHIDSLFIRDEGNNLLTGNDIDSSVDRIFLTCFAISRINRTSMDPSISIRVTG